MAKLLFSIAATILFYLLNFEIYSISIFAIFVLPTSIYFVVRRSKKPDTLHTVTLILTIAVMILPRLRGGGAPSVTPFYAALIVSILYDLVYATRFWYLAWTTFWSLIAWGYIQLYSQNWTDKSWVIFIAVA